MEKILIVGNPNTGKSTLFNSLTKSEEHTGNWHGVTVDAKSKIVKLEGVSYEFYDLPGLYSLDCYTMEEQVSKDFILNNVTAKILFCADANTLERNIFLLTQLLDLGFNVKLLINNYSYFSKRGGKIDTTSLSKSLKCEVVIIDARKQKLTKELIKFKDEKTIKFSSEKYENLKSLLDKKRDTIERYKKIENILNSSRIIPQNDIYGQSKADKFLFKPLIFILLFALGFFLILYLTFFLIGPKISSGLASIINIIIVQPSLYFLKSINAPNFVMKLFDEGIFSAGITICSFLPQICLLYLFLTILEESGLISRFAFILDDSLTKIGLNGKIVYTMLMGFGCNTTACYTAKNMADKNSKVKSALITPFMSCTAKLPVYTVVATAILGTKNFLLIIGLYLLGIIVALVLAGIYEKTILKSKNDTFLLEFPPLRFPSFSLIFKSSIKTSKMFISKVFGVIFSMSVVIYLLKNLTFSFRLTENVENSMLYNISRLILPIFKPLGIRSPELVATLVIGLVAKELIVSTMLIFNKVSTTQGLIKSIAIAYSPISFSLASGISFLILVLLYSPCVSTVAVMFKEIGKKYTILGLVVQFGVAYFLATLCYQLMIGNFVMFLIWLLALFIIFLSFKFLYKKIKSQKCVNSSTCNSCPHHCQK